MNDMAAPQHCVVFATPTYDHRVTLEYLRSLTETEWALASAHILHGYVYQGGDQFIAKVRNKLVWRFLTHFPMATDLFFLDDDVGWPADKVIEFIHRPEDIVAGIYPKKSEMVDFPVELACDGATGELIERDGLYQALGIPMGFTRIKRHVLEKLAKHAQTFKDQEIDGNPGEYPGIFETGIGSDGWWWGEDHTFCRKWLDLGGSIWVDPSISFAHRGHRKWEARLSDHLDTFRDRAVKAVETQKTKNFDINAGEVVA